MKKLFALVSVYYLLFSSFSHLCSMEDVIELEVLSEGDTVNNGIHENGVSEIWVETDYEKELGFFDAYFNQQQYMIGYSNNEEIMRGLEECARNDGSEWLHVLAELHENIPHYGWHMPFTFPDPLNNDAIKVNITDYIQDTQELVGSNSIQNEHKRAYIRQRLNFLSHLKKRLEYYPYGEKMKYGPLCKIGGYIMYGISLFWGGSMVSSLACDGEIPALEWGFELGSLAVGTGFMLVNYQTVKPETKESYEAYCHAKEQLGQAYATILSFYKNDFRSDSEEV